MATHRQRPRGARTATSAEVASGLRAGRDRAGPAGGRPRAKTAAQGRGPRDRPARASAATIDRLETGPTPTTAGEAAAATFRSLTLRGSERPTRGSAATCRSLTLRGSERPTRGSAATCRSLTLRGSERPTRGRPLRAVAHDRRTAWKTAHAICYTGRLGGGIQQAGRSRLAGAIRQSGFAWGKARKPRPAVSGVGAA